MAFWLTARCVAMDCRWLVIAVSEVFTLARAALTYPLYVAVAEVDHQENQNQPDKAEPDVARHSKPGE